MREVLIGADDFMSFTKEKCPKKFLGIFNRKHDLRKSSKTHMSCGYKFDVICTRCEKKEEYTVYEKLV